MTVIHWHIARTLLIAASVVLLAMLALVALFAVVEELRDTENGYGFADALWYITLTLPRRALEILPYSVFLGCLVGLGSLAEHSELTVARAAGMSPWQLFRGVAVAAICLLVGGVVVSEWVAPAGEERAELFKNQQLQASDEVVLSGGYWYREGNLFMNIDGLDDQGALTGVRQFVYDDDKSLLQAKRAESAWWQADTSSWELRDVLQTELKPLPMGDEMAFALRGEALPGELPEQLVRPGSIKAQSWHAQASPRLLSARMLVDENRLSIADLYYQINYMRREKLSVTTYELAFWTRLQQPFAVLGLALLAMVFVLGPLRQVSIGLRVSAGVLIGLSFKYLQDLFAPMSLVYGLPPVLAVAIPIALCWLVAIIALRRV